MRWRPMGSMEMDGRLETQMRLEPWACFFFFFYYFLPTVYLLLDYMYGKHDERLWIPTPRHVTTTSTYYGHDERRLGARDAYYEYVCFFLVSYFFFFRLTEWFFTWNFLDYVYRNFDNDKWPANRWQEFFFHFVINTYTLYINISI